MAKKQTQRLTTTRIVIILYETDKKRKIQRNNQCTGTPPLPIHYHHQTVLPKCRSSTAGAGTKVAVPSKARLPPQTQEPRCSSAQRQVFYCKLRNQGYSSAQRQDFHCKLRKQGWSYAQRQVFHLKLRNQDYCSAEDRCLPPHTQVPRLQFYQGRKGVETSRGLLHTTLSLASEKTLKDLKRSEGHQRGGEENGFGYLDPPDFTEIHHRG